MLVKKLLSVLAVVLLIALPVFAHGKKAKALPHFKEGITKVSENEHFSIEIVPDPASPKAGKNKVKVYLHDSDGDDLEGARVALEITDKSSGTKSKENPKAYETEKGEYIVRNVIYEKAGVYLIKVIVKKKDDTDSATFELEVK